MTIRRTLNDDQRLIIGGLASGMIAYFVFGTADTIALGAKVGIFFWIALALIVAVHEQVASTQPITSDPDAEPRFAGSS
jgi:hypothetical protein